MQVVLDEGHNIKNYNTKVSRAAGQLDCLRRLLSVLYSTVLYCTVLYCISVLHCRWIVTGTPIQNNLLELWSLVTWLRFGVYAGRANLQLFRNQIELPCKRGQSEGFERLQVLVDAVCLRRTKADRTSSGPLVPLPAKQVLTRQVELSQAERRCYAHYHAQARAVISRYRRRGELLSNYAHVFALMTRLRQICCHAQLVPDTDWEQLAAAAPDTETHARERVIRELRALLGAGVSAECGYCLAEPRLPVITACGHLFCRDCLDIALEAAQLCPLCGAVVARADIVETVPSCAESRVLARESARDIAVRSSSSKATAALAEVARILRSCPGEKVVVVSQFTSFLSILQPLLRERRIPFLRLDGSMTHLKRAESVRRFQSSSRHSAPVLLLRSDQPQTFTHKLLLQLSIFQFTNYSFTCLL